MSLLRQIILSITVLILLLMSGNLVVSVHNARDYFSDQLSVHAQDTATSLGFTISSAAQAKDLATVNSMMDAIFDRGYFRQISYKDLSGKVLADRQQPIAIEGVPQWFIDWLALPQPSGTAEVVSGWYRLGAIEVVAHTGFAYRDLWRVFMEQLWLAVATATLSYLFAGLFLAYLLRPLKRVEKQAEAICRREFPVQERLPRTPELRRMVLAMNRMVNKIKTMFEEQLDLTERLHRKSNIDPVTELPNRRDFDARFESFIKSEQGGGHGLLVLLQISGLLDLNRTQGREAGDQCLRDIAERLREALAEIPSAIVSRRGGADFCAFVPSIEVDASRQLLTELHQHIVQLSWFEQYNDLQLHAGAVYSETVTLGNQLLGQADLLLRQQQQQGDSSWALAEQSDSAYTSGEWRQLLQEVIQRQALHFHFQPVFTAGVVVISPTAESEPQVMMVEAFCRITDNEQVIPAGQFWPMVERHQLGEQVDRLVIEKMAIQLSAPAPAKASGARICVNIGSASICSEEFMHWLLMFLEHQPQVARRLIFEVPEKAIATAEQRVREFVLAVKALGVECSLDNFGSSNIAYHYLQSIPFDYIKIDRCCITQLDQRQDNQFYVKSLVQMAHSCDLRVIAEGIETEAEWHSVAALGFDGGQGYFLAEPSAATSEID